MQCFRAVNGNHDGRVRWATNDDVPAISQLMRDAQTVDGIPRISEVEVGELMARGGMIVLVIDHALMAAACLTTAPGHGPLAFVVAKPGISGLEEQIRGVAALVESEGGAPMLALDFQRAS